MYLNQCCYHSDCYHSDTSCSPPKKNKKNRNYNNYKNKKKKEKEKEKKEEKEKKKENNKKKRELACVRITEKRIKKRKQKIYFHHTEGGKKSYHDISHSVDWAD